MIKYIAHKDDRSWEWTYEDNKETFVPVGLYDRIFIWLEDCTVFYDGQILVVSDGFEETYGRIEIVNEANRRGDHSSVDLDRVIREMIRCALHPDGFATDEDYEKFERFFVEFPQIPRFIP